MEDKKMKGLLFLILVISIGFNIFFLFIKERHVEESIDMEIVQNSIPLPTELQNILQGQNIENTNIFEKTYQSFKNINNFNEYIDWRDIYSQKFLLISLVKMQDYDNWNKYYSFLYDYYIKNEGGNFGEDFKKDMNFNKSQDPKENFLLYMQQFYNNIISSSNIIVTKENIDNDLNMTFANNDFSELKNLCEYRQQNIDESMDVNSCMDDNYFYRSTKENGYCEKISDPYKIKLCNDFLSYQSK